MKTLGYIISLIFLKREKIKNLIKRKPKKLTENDLILQDIIFNINEIDIKTCRSFLYKNIHFYIEKDDYLLYRYIDHSRICCRSLLVEDLRILLKDIEDNEKTKFP